MKITKKERAEIRSANRQSRKKEQEEKTVRLAFEAGQDAHGCGERLPLLQTARLPLQPNTQAQLRPPPAPDRAQIERQRPWRCGGWSIGVDGPQQSFSQVAADTVFRQPAHSLADKPRAPCIRPCPWTAPSRFRRLTGNPPFNPCLHGSSSYPHENMLS